MQVRALLASALLALAILAAPMASATGFTLGADRHMGSGATEGAAILFDMPVTLHENGFVYAKLLVTDGNAVNDGSRANGTLAPASGWWIETAWKRADGSRAELGAAVDGTPTQTVSVRAGELDHFITTVHVAADAARGGALQKVYVALAFRLAQDGAATGDTSGGQLDEARALTLTLKLDGSAVITPPADASGNETSNASVTPTPLLDGGSGATAPAPGGGPAGDGSATGASGDSGASGSGGSASGGTGSGSSSDDGLAAPPVTGIPLGASGSGVDGASVGAAAVPTWFLVWASVLLTSLTMAMIMMAFLIVVLFRRGSSELHIHLADGEIVVAREGQRVRTVPLQEGDAKGSPSSTPRVVRIEEDR